jgi:hypothetical protein
MYCTADTILHCLENWFGGGYVLYSSQDRPGVIIIIIIIILLLLILLLLLLMPACQIAE